MKIYFGANNLIITIQWLYQFKLPKKRLQVSVKKITHTAHSLWVKILLQKYYSNSALRELNMSVSYMHSKSISHLFQALSELQHLKNVT